MHKRVLWTIIWRDESESSVLVILFHCANNADFALRSLKTESGLRNYEKQTSNEGFHVGRRRKKKFLKIKRNNKSLRNREPISRVFSFWKWQLKVVLKPYSSSQMMQGIETFYLNCNNYRWAEVLLRDYEPIKELAWIFNFFFNFEFEDFFANCALRALRCLELRWISSLIYLSNQRRATHLRACETLFPNIDAICVHKVTGSISFYLYQK